MESRRVLVAGAATHMIARIAAGTISSQSPSCETSGFEPSEFADIFAVLRAKGGFCDCEILCNASQSNRLKAQYWCGRTEREEPRRSHAPRPPAEPKNSILAA